MPVNFPGQDKQYKIKSGDTLWGIAGIAYGDSTKWPKIWEANKNNLRSGDPNLIFPDEIIYIPKEDIKKVSEADDISGKEKDQFTLMINGREIVSTSGVITKTIDTACDGWTANVPWEPDEDPEIDAALLPFGFQEAKVYLGNRLMVNGQVYIITPVLSSSGRSKTCEGFSYTADIVDSTMKQPYEARRLTLEERANQLVSSLGIDVVSEITTDGIFDRVTADPQDKIFDHLATLARQRSALISNTRQGKLLITSANINGKPVATIEEQIPLTDAFTATFNARELFNIYIALGQSPRAAKKVGKATDINVPKSRQLTFTADESTPGNISQVAEYRRNKEYVKAFSIKFPVSSWYSDEANLVLWDVNTIVEAKSLTLGFPDGFKFLIRQVDYVYDENGTSAVLYLVPPESYSNQPVKLPWGAQ